jgi:hypothetical protein
MFASMWLTEISYVCKPHKILPFLFVGMTTMRVADEEGNAMVARAMATATKVSGKG